MIDKPTIIEGESRAESAYVRKTSKEIKDLAASVREGNVFGSWNISKYEIDNLSMVFLPLSFISEIQRKEMIRDGIVHFYGDLRGRGVMPRSINGMPIFSEFSMINQEDFERLQKAVKLIDEFMEKSDDV